MRVFIVLPAVVPVDSMAQELIKIARQLLLLVCPNIVENQQLKIRT